MILIEWLNLNYDINYFIPFFDFNVIDYKYSYFLLLTPKQNFRC